MQHLDIAVCFADQVEVETKVVPGTESEGGRMLRWAEEWPRHDTRGQRERNETRSGKFLFLFSTGKLS